MAREPLTLEEHTKLGEQLKSMNGFLCKLADDVGPRVRKPRAQRVYGVIKALKSLRSALEDELIENSRAWDVPREQTLKLYFE